MTSPRNRAPRTALPCTHDGIHEHGERVTYVKDGCRCDPCTTAARVYEQRRRRDRLYGITAGLVDAQPVRDHLAVLSAAGIGYKRAAKLAGVSVTTVQTILYNHPDRPFSGPAKRVKESTAEKLLAVQPVLELVSDGTYVPARGAARRIQALVARGWSQAKLADRIGITDQRIGPLLRGGNATAGTVRSIHQVYEELWDQAPPLATHRDRLAASRARNHAQRSDWAPPAAWDDIDHDPAPAARRRHPPHRRGTPRRPGVPARCWHPGPRSRPPRRLPLDPLGGARSESCGPQQSRGRCPSGGGVSEPPPSRRPRQAAPRPRRTHRRDR